MKRVPVWLPYTKSIEILPQGNIRVFYNGGMCDIKLEETSSILLYGTTPPLPEKFLIACAKAKVPICFHRRNVATATWILPSISGGNPDVITPQIFIRQNQKKRLMIANRLIAAKFRSMSWLMPNTTERSLGEKTLQQLRSRESTHAKKYWERYFKNLNMQNVSRRNGHSNIKSSLDAVSKLISGILLRYIIYHRLSPYHGFLHEPTDYPALVYDLMEPYRGYFDRIVFNVYEKHAGKVDEKELLSYCIKSVEQWLDTNVYCPTTRQVVSFQELLHGCVLALRAYLLGETTRFIIPQPGKPNGGRPVKAGYHLYGRAAGPTNFWSVADSVNERFEEVFEKPLSTP